MSFPGPLVDSRTLGRWRIHAIQAGGQQLDGGAMFGVVPKPLWEKRAPADNRNRILLGMRPLLVRGERTMLIDAGAGGLSRDSKAQAEHVRAISPDRLGARLGRLPPAIMDRVDRALRLHLAL